MSRLSEGPKELSTNDRIIRAALALVAQHGFGSLTMNKIALTAGVSRQTLYNHYSDIDGIVAEAIRSHDRESVQLLASAMRVVESPKDKLEQLIRHVVSIAIHADHAPGIERGLSAEARASLGEYEGALNRCIREVLEAGQQTGEFRGDLKLETDIILVRHMLNGLAERSAKAPDEAAAIVTAGIRTIVAAVAEP